MKFLYGCLSKKIWKIFPIIFYHLLTLRKVEAITLQIILKIGELFNIKLNTDVIFIQLENPSEHEPISKKRKKSGCTSQETVFSVINAYTCILHGNSKYSEKLL